MRPTSPQKNGKTTRWSLRTRALVGLLAAAPLAAALAGCRQEGAGRSSSGYFGSTASGATASGPNLGAIAYETIHSNIKKTGSSQELAALERRKQSFIDAVNRAIPTGASSTVWATIRKFLPLVDDNTIPLGVQDLRNIVDAVAKDPAVCQAIADLTNGSTSAGPIDRDEMVRLLSRFLAYPDLDTVARSGADFCKANPTLVDSVLGVASRQLKAVTPDTFATSAPLPGLDSLSQEILRDADMGGFGDVGAPAWAVVRDKNGNPAVAVDAATGKVFPPFVDDGSGVATLGSNGKPADAQDQEIRVKPFGSDGLRDSYGRALGPGGQPLFQYVDAKRTTLGQALILTGEALQKQLPTDIFFLLDKLIDRETHTDANGQTYETLKRGGPLCDLGWAQMELVRRTPMPQMLSGLGEVVKNDPAKFQDMASTLVVALDKAKKSGFTTAGQMSMVDDLIPLLSAATKPNGKQTTAVRALLQEFTKAQAQLHDLPRGFARMMRFNDYGKQIPAGPGAPSVMQRLLDVMKRSDQCSPMFLGNLAELYIDTMAGNNKPILGIKLDVKSMNNLMKIGILRNLLCSKLNADDCQVLQDFVDTGSLDAFIPIAKAFSDRGETRLLVDIMLRTGDHYEQAMRPNEPAVIKLLESGAVEKLFLVLDQMTRIKVPGTSDVVADVLADTVGVLVDDSKPLADRQGRQYRTLLHMVKQPLDDLAALVKGRGEQARWDRIVQGVMDTFLAIYKDPVTGLEKVRACGLIHGLGEILAFVAQQIPADPAQRSAWADAKTKAVEDLLSARDVVVIIDIVRTVKASPQAQAFDAAIANILASGKQTVKDDALGAVCSLVASLLQAHPRSVSTANPQTTADAIAKLCNFLGDELDPAAGKVKNVISMLRRMVQVDDGLLLLNIGRNLFDMGQNGNLDAPIVVILDTLDEVKKAAPATAAGPATGSSVADGLRKTISFLDDPKDGLEGIFKRIKSRFPK